MGTWRGFEVGGRRVVLAGGDGWALGTATALIHAGARVRLIAADATPALIDLAERGHLELINATFEPGHLDGAALVIISDDDHDAAEAAADRGVLTFTAHPVDRPGRKQRTGEVVLVGGGPGDPGLLTIAGLQAIKEADVIATDRLAPLSALSNARDDAEIIDVGKIPRGAGVGQDTIEELLIDRARAGNKVVRFKGGDSFVFGRGGEEWQACAAAGIPVTVIPGVTSASAAPAAAGIPLTHRALSQGFTVVTGHLPPEDPRTMINWEALAASGTTLVIMMGMANLSAITMALVSYGMDPGTPALVVEDGTLPSMRVVRASVTDIADRAAEAGLGAPATVVIGAVAGFSPTTA